LIGKTLAHYEITELIGKGGMGEVYRARDTKLERDVAIKILPREMSGDPERIARFRREARTLASLQHNNVASIYGFEDTADARFLVMELVEGEDLEQRVARGPIPVEETVDIARQIAAGLEIAHDSSVMHRDLKPANVKISPDGAVKILDFGLARAWLGDAEENVDPAHSPTITAAMTQAGTILGTAAYMSPEQARGKRVDRRADIWAFGVILVEMLRGQTLFPGETVSDTLAAVLKTEIDLSTLPKDTPSGLRSLIERCLDRNPATRLRDIGEARVALERPLGGAPVPTNGRPTHRGRMFLFGALAGVILGTMAMMVFRGEDEAAPERQVRFSIPRTPGESVPRSALALDGTRLLYVDQQKLWVRDFDEPESRAVEGSEGALVCNWSPDGAWIVWSTSNTIYKARPDGSGRVRLCEVGTDMHPWAGAVDWNEDGRVLFSPGDAGVFSVSASGGDPAVHVPTVETDTDFHDIEVLPGDHGVIFQPHMDLRFDALHLVSPNGRKELLSIENQQLYAAQYSRGHLVFARRPDNAGVWAVPYSLSDEQITGEPFMAVPDAVFPTVSRTGDLVYVPDAPLLLQLVRLDRQGEIVAELGDAIEGADQLKLSPDGTQAAVVVEGQTNEIWIVDLESGQRQRFVYDDQRLSTPSWSPDGTRIIYSIGGSGPELHLEIRSVEGGAPDILNVRGFSPRFTPDGRYVVLEFWDEHNDPGIGYIDLENFDDGVVPIVDSMFAEESPELSPDGRLIVYESLEPGSREIFLTTFPDGDRTWQISTEAGSQPLWTPDGKTVVFRSASRPEKMAIDISTDPVRFGSPRLLFRIDNVAWLHPAADGEFYGLLRTGGVSQSSYEVWLGWAESLDR
jgi:Tol biopolymer transport system component